MTGLDAEAIVKEAEALLARLDELRLQLEGFQRELRAAAEQQLRGLVEGSMPPERRAAADKLVVRGLRIADEVSAWVVGRSPVGLAQRLLPELRAGMGELQQFLMARPLGDPRLVP